MRERIARLKLIRPRTRRVILGSVAAITAFVLIVPAFAGPVGDNAGFEDDDGNLVDGATAGIDWNTFAPTTWTGTANLRTATDTAAGWTLTGKEDLQATTSDSGFAGGTKQDNNCPSVITAKAPNKDDLKRVYLAKKTVPIDEDNDPDTDPVDHVFLMLSWIRITQNTTSPSAHIGFEFNKGSTACGTGHPLVNRTLGDMLIVYDFEGGAGDAPVLTLRRWVTSGACEVSSNSPPCWGTAQDLTADGDAEGKVNTTATALDQVADPDETLGLNEFGEAGVDLTDAGVFTPGVCENFGKAYAVSRSSGNSGTAQMKDLVGPVPFELQNCGSVKIIKQTNPRGLDQNFSFTSTLAGSTISCTSDTTPASFTLNDSGNAGKTAGSSDPAQNSAGNTETCTNVPVGSYTVTEGADPSGFAFGSLSCTASTGSSGAQDGTVLKQANISLIGGGSVTCIYTNNQQLGAIKVVKVAKNKNCSNATPPTGCDNGKAPLSGAGFQIWLESNGLTGLQIAETPGTPPTPADTLVKAQQLTAADGTRCFDSLTFNDAAHPYYVHESATPTGYGGAADQTVVISSNTTCAGSPVVKNFENTPLSTIQVKVTSLGGAGVTRSQIVCKQGTTVVPAVSENGSADNETTPAYDDSDETFGNGTSTLPPGVYTCTIDIDP